MQSSGRHYVNTLVSMHAIIYLDKCLQNQCKKQIIPIIDQHKIQYVQYVQNKRSYVVTGASSGINTVRTSYSKTALASWRSHDFFKVVI